MNGLSLCSGIGGLELGLKIALGTEYRTVCYVELDAYSASVLVARMADKAMDDAPIWDDLRTFDGKRWRGKVDIVTAGFPCQPVSVAGRKRGIEDERWLWPDIARVVRQVRPRWVFLENVRNLLSANDGGAFAQVLGGLADLGYDAEWGVFSASRCGAPHRRERVFILGHSRKRGLPRDDGRGSGEVVENGYKELANAENVGWRSRGAGIQDGDGGLPRTPISVQKRWKNQDNHSSGNGTGIPTWPPGPEERDRWNRILSIRPDLAPATQSPLRGMAHGSSNRVDRLRCLGNAVVPVVAAVAFVSLYRRMVA